MLPFLLHLQFAIFDSKAILMIFSHPVELRTETWAGLSDMRAPDIGFVLIEKYASLTEEHKRALRLNFCQILLLCHPKSFPKRTVTNKLIP